jgi:hypothetical protein
MARSRREPNSPKPTNTLKKVRRWTGFGPVEVQEQRVGLGLKIVWTPGSPAGMAHANPGVSRLSRIISGSTYQICLPRLGQVL